MEYIFTNNKDGHKKGEVIDLKPSDFRLMYWTRKQVIEPFFREQELEITHNEPTVTTPEQTTVETAKKKKIARRVKP
jgi:hypothetical protein